MRVAAPPGASGLGVKNSRWASCGTSWVSASATRRSRSPWSTTDSTRHRGRFGRTCTRRDCVGGAACAGALSSSRCPSSCIRAQSATPRRSSRARASSTSHHCSSSWTATTASAWGLDRAASRAHAHPRPCPAQGLGRARARRRDHPAVLAAGARRARSSRVAAEAVPDARGVASAHGIRVVALLAAEATCRARCQRRGLT